MQVCTNRQIDSEKSASSYLYSSVPYGTPPPPYGHSYNVESQSETPPPYSSIYPKDSWSSARSSVSAFFYQTEKLTDRLKGCWNQDVRPSLAGITTGMVVGGAAINAARLLLPSGHLGCALWGAMLGFSHIHRRGLDAALVDTSKTTAELFSTAFKGGAKAARIFYPTILVGGLLSLASPLFLPLSISAVYFAFSLLTWMPAIASVCAVGCVLTVGAAKFLACHAFQAVQALSTTSSKSSIHSLPNHPESLVYQFFGGQPPQFQKFSVNPTEA